MYYVEGIDHRSLKAAKKHAQRIANRTGRSVEIVQPGGRVMWEHETTPTPRAKRAKAIDVFGAFKDLMK